ncbi:MAG: hypothetical protein JRS35_22475 [Deltaproteobacteria bacterium]|nr:hypothetical protein [Deltaproteobacteria bacterium]
MQRTLRHALAFMNIPGKYPRGMAEMMGRLLALLLLVHGLLALTALLSARAMHRERETQRRTDR